MGNKGNSYPFTLIGHETNDYWTTNLKNDLLLIVLQRICVCFISNLDSFLETISSIKEFPTNTVVSRRELSVS